MSSIVFIFGRRVKYYRSRQKMSQEILAERSGLHPTYIGQVERGEKNCTLETAEKIADGLGVTLKDLLFELPIKSPEDYEPEIIPEIEKIISVIVHFSYKKLRRVTKIIELIADM